MLRALFSGGHKHLELGIGDDAAVLGGTAESTVWTIDAAVEGVHFRRGLLSMREIGYRSATAALSDLAAMGARPVAVLSGLILPGDVEDEGLKELALGQKEAVERVGAVVAGGNLSRGGELSITTAAMGTARKPLRRDGAKPGDRVYLCGPVGLSHIGLTALMRGIPVDLGEVAKAIEAFKRPVAYVEPGLGASEWATAAIDISDGLSADAGHLAKASGVVIVLEEQAIVSGELERVAEELNKEALWCALSGGEDYALLVTGPGIEPPHGFKEIGYCEALTGESREGGVVLIRKSGERLNVNGLGFDHFSQAKSG